MKSNFLSDALGPNKNGHAFAGTDPVVTTPFIGGEATVSQQEVKFEITTPSQSEQLQQSMGLLSMLNPATQNVSHIYTVVLFIFGRPKDYGFLLFCMIASTKG